MEVRLLSHTPEIDRLVYTAARTCYSNLTPSDIWEDSHANKQELIRRIIESGHHSVLEHVVFNFEVAGISRAASHQLVRHRLASYSQQSQRYVEPRNGLSYV
ncbi:FAD-dependent thymidylate synthase, partial [Candidatus Sumerlaeota bacterium]|nr:FAD-dependent thymidylate synthase [Candidatus Sumerlaeota bacterium]